MLEKPEGNVQETLWTKGRNYEEWEQELIKRAEKEAKIAYLLEEAKKRIDAAMNPPKAYTEKPEARKIILETESFFAIACILNAIKKFEPTDAEKLYDNVIGLAEHLKGV